MTTRGSTTNNLIEAIHAGRLSGVIKALDDGEDIELPDMHGFRGLPLRTACFAGHLAIVRELLSHGANPDADASDGPGAPLRLALREGHQEIIDLLIQQGAAIPEGFALSPEILDISCDSLPDEAIVSLPPEDLPGNAIEFTPSIVSLPTDEVDASGHFGAATNVLSMDLLFLDENEIGTIEAPELPKDKR